MKWKVVSKPGSAPSSVRTELVAPEVALSTPKSPSIGTTASEAMGAGSPMIYPASSPLTSSAEITGSSGLSSMAWTENPQTVVEQPWQQWQELDLSILPGEVRSKLKTIAEGTGEPVEAVIHQICDYLIEASNEDAGMASAIVSDGTLRDAVIFYIENETI